MITEAQARAARDILADQAKKNNYPLLGLGLTKDPGNDSDYAIMAHLASKKDERGIPSSIDHVRILTRVI